MAGRLLFTDKTATNSTPFLFEVPYGSKAKVTLPDGSKVILNAGSKLTCKEGFGKTHRLLSLTGEGYFDVAKNKSLPFIVRAGDLFVKALGTEFNVKAYPEDKNIEAILIRGAIQVNKTEAKENKPLTLMPKQSLVYNKSSDHFQINITDEKVKKSAEKQPLPITASPSSNVEIFKTAVDPAIYTSWKDTSWIIYHTELSDLAVDLERKYNVKIHFDSDVLKHIKFTGTLRDESLEQILSAICLASPVEFKIKGKQVELTENKKLIKAYEQYFHYSGPN